MAEVVLEAVGKAFGGAQVLRQIDLAVRDGEFMVFVGPSGCGKSTLLRTIAGLEEITSGELSIGGRVVNDIPPAERGIAMVFQSYALYPHMNLYENMAFGLKLARMPADQIDSAVKNAARILHIEQLLERKPKDLSGGQRQRVAIGRAIARKPEVFLFDEPLSNLDAALRVKMRYEFAKLHEELKTTMIYVTHDQVEAMTLADRTGTVGTAAASEVTEALSGGGSVRCLVDGSRATAGDKVTLGIRPEHFEISSAHAGAQNALPARVTFVETLGSATVAYCEYPGVAEPLTCELDGRVRPRSGDTVTLGVPASVAYLFDAGGRSIRRLAPGQLEQCAA